MPELLSSADVGIAPYDASQYEPLIKYGFFWSPAKLFEYSACGLPVVCSRYDLLAEVVEDGVTGYLVPPGDARALADAVIKLCRDSDVCARMGAKGRQRVLEEFSWDHHAEYVAEILEQILQDRR